MVTLQLSIPQGGPSPQEGPAGPVHLTATSATVLGLPNATRTSAMTDLFRSLGQRTAPSA